MKGRESRQKTAAKPARAKSKEKAAVKATAETPKARARAVSPEELRVRNQVRDSTIFRTLSTAPAPLPEIEAPSLDDLKVYVEPPDPITEEEMLDRLDALLRRTLLRERKQGEKVAMGDSVALDVMGFCSGRLIPFSAEQGLEVVLEEGMLMPGLAEALVGSEVGKNVQVRVNLPEDYPVEALRGKPAVFAVSVIRAGALPDEINLDDKKTLKVFKMGDTLEKLLESLGEQAVADREQATQWLAQNLVLDALVGRSKTNVPDANVDHEIARQWWTSEGQFLFVAEIPAEDREHSLKSWLADPALREEARRKLAVTQVLTAVAKANNVQMTPAEFKSAVKEALEEAGEKVDDLDKQLREDPETVVGLANVAIYQRAIDLVVSKAEISVGKAG